MNEFEWERVFEGDCPPQYDTVKKMKIKGGYLYSHIIANLNWQTASHAMVFVPNSAYIPESKVNNDLLSLIKKMRDRLDVAEKQIEDLELKLAAHIQNRGCEIPLPLPPKVKCLHDWDFREGVCNVCGAKWRFFMGQPCNAGDIL